jgi:hypothetical protein
MALITGPVIRTRFLGPTNHRGSRVVAEHRRDSLGSWRSIVSYDHGVDAIQNHYRAALDLIESCPMSEWGVQVLAVGVDRDGYFFTVGDPPDLD